MSHSPAAEREFDWARNDDSEFRKSLRHINELMRRGGSLSGHERNCLFLNTKGSPFATASAVTGFDFADDARGAVTVDWDADGDLDVWLSNRTAPRVRFLCNNQPNPNSITLQLKGIRCNRDAIGAQVRLFTTDDRLPIMKSVRAGEGYLSQSSKHLVFGLGGQTRAERVEIAWPGGERQNINGLSAGRYLVEQASEPVPLRDRLAVKYVQASESTSGAVSRRVALTDPIPAPRLPVRSLDSDVTFDALEGTGPTLINLWASWCRPCLEELQAFRDRYDDIQDSQLKIVAVCVDETLQSENAEAAANFAIKVPFQIANATSELISRLKVIHEMPFATEVSMPVPLSFLLDAEDRVVAFYRGPVAIDTLLQDVGALRRGSVAWQAQALPLAGRWNQKPKPVSRLLVPRDLLSRQQTDDALEFVDRFAAELATDRELPVLRAWLGDQLIDRERVREGLKQYAAALRQDPNDLTLINNYAWQLATGRDEASRDGKRAIEWAERAAKLTGYKNAGILDTLAAAYAEAGDFERAVAAAATAVRLAEPKLAERIGKRKLGYQRREPYRQ